MHGPLRSATAILILLAACKFPEPPPFEIDASDASALEDAATATDAPDPDAAPLGPAALALTQGPHAFSPIVIGAQSPVLQVTVRNTGEEATGALMLQLAGATPGEFRIVPTGDTSDCQGATLAGGATCVAQVGFMPTVDGAPTARLEVTAAPGGSVSVTLSGDALTPAALATTQGAYDFGDIVTGQASNLLSLVVRNSGEQQTGVIAVMLGAPNPGEFQVVPTGMANDCADARLAFQNTCVVQVRFRPTTAATRTSALTVSASPGNSVNVPLTGDGLTQGTLVVELPANGSIDFGTREIGTGASSTPTTIRLRNTGGAPTGALSVAIGGGGGSYTTPSGTCNGIALGANMTCDVGVRFAPGAVGSIPATITVRDTVAMTAASVPVTGTGSARVSTTKTGAGTIASTPAGIDCGTGCTTQTGTFTQTPVSLTATADAGWIFGAWTGACAAANPSPVCSVALTQGLTNVGATFTQVFTLTVATTGSGTVTSSTPGILCGNGNPDCMETYPVSTTVQLEAEPDAGWEVFSWSPGGTCAPGARTCSVLMNQTRNVAVVFRRQYTLTVTASGSGTVSGAPIVNCTESSGTCVARVFDATSVTLTRAIGAVGTNSQNLFDWGGTCDSAGTAATCTFTVDGNEDVSATFTLQHRLTLSIEGAGGGTVTGPSVSCTGSCFRFYNADTVLTLTATANAVSAFSGWMGACLGATCTNLVMDAPKAVAATFTPVMYTLTVAKTGVGTGTVTGTGFNCGGDCMESVSPGTMVTLTATPTAGDVFFGWSGAGINCPGTGNCTIMVNATQTVTAVFDSCSRNTTVCDDSTEIYTQCSPTGAATVEMTCVLGCATGVEKCLDIKPSNDTATNELSTLLDQAATAADVTCPSGAACTLNTDTCAATSLVPASPPPGSLVAGVGCVLRTKTLNIQGNLRVTGSRAVVLLSHGDLTISGTLDVSADGAEVRGPGSQLTGACVGRDKENTTLTSGGAGGAGHMDRGGAGGSAPGVPGASSADGYLDAERDVIPLVGGCKGGNMWQPSANPSGILEGASGGYGGGAAQLVSRTRITVTSTGVIDATGGGGRSATQIGTDPAGGSGGGSGGALLFEAPRTFLSASSILTTRGGGGSAAGGNVESQNGRDGHGGATPGAGGVSALGNGGPGGIETCVELTSGTGCPGVGRIASGSNDAGGGGGSVGVVRFNTRFPLSQDPSAVLRTKVSPGNALLTRQVP